MREWDVFANVQMYYGEYVNLATGIWCLTNIQSASLSNPGADENQ